MRTRLPRSFSSSAVRSETALARIRIVSVNDVYELANLPRLRTFLDGLAVAPPDATGRRAGEALRCRKKEPQPPSAVVLAGDFLSPSTLSSIDGGRGMVATLRAVGTTHVSLGNHEQDLRLESLRERLGDLSEGPATGTGAERGTDKNTNTNTTTDACTESATTEPGKTQLPRRKRPRSNHADPPCGSHPACGPVVVLNTNMRRDLPKKAEWMQSVTRPHSLVSSPCGRATIALLGLLSDEPGLFRDNTFKSVPIQNVLDAYTEAYQSLVEGDEGGATGTRDPPVDLLVPVTHASLVRDGELAEHMLALHGGPGLILGGHEHDPYHEMVAGAGQSCSSNSSNSNSNSNGNHEETTSEDAAIHILKSGMDARNACLVDLVFEIPDTERAPEQAIDTGTTKNVPPRLVEITSELIDLSEYEPSPRIQKIVDKHMSVVQALEDEIIIDAGDEYSSLSLPPGVLLSSEGTRFRQTTIGGFFCQMIKEELEECDVAMLNGAVIKGGVLYRNAKMSYAQLKKELPFPTKIVEVEMTPGEVRDAIHYSRTAVEAGTEAGGAEPPRRGYLQVDRDFDDRMKDPDGGEDSGGGASFLRVALPRNLLNGFCKIEPLMAVGKRLKGEGRFPGDDDFVPAIDLVVRHASKNRWLHLLSDETDFERFDLNDDGVLDKHEVRAMMRDALGYEPADFVVEDMVAAIDLDENGTIDPDEFQRLVVAQQQAAAAAAATPVTEQGNHHGSEHPEKQ
ncbi:unnamed protein product [Pseudo-nitzschia multistriata]|uniref:EF-hand domain-containing protein n=1 Tax=Pseudo-nitzschia multistriata TaxID=183589 RepID=A0A448Z8Z3_9STRA|nr:unnamed protein product [Pseudo-nitzschia multistriata]